MTLRNNRRTQPRILPRRSQCNLLHVTASGAATLLYRAGNSYDTKLEVYG